MNAAIDASAMESSVLSYYWPITQIFNTSRGKSLKVAPDPVFFSLSNAVMKKSDLAWVAKNDENTHNLFCKLMGALKAFPHSLMKILSLKALGKSKKLHFQPEERDVNEVNFPRTLDCRSIHPYFGVCSH